MSQLLSRQSLGLAFVILSGIGVVIMPTMAKIAQESGSDNITIAFTRGFVATALLFFILLIRREKLTLPKALLRPSLIAGLAGATFVYSLYGAILYTNISLVILIIYTYPVTLALYEHVSGAAKLSRGQWLFMSMATIGLAFIVGIDLGNVDLLGVFLALLGMVSCVIITLANHQVTQQIGSLRSNLYMSLWSAIIFFYILLFFGEFREPNSPIGWIGLVGNGLGYSIAWVAFFSGARILGTTRASIITLIDPPMAALVTWIIFGQLLTQSQWVGFVVVLISLVAFEMQSRTFQRSSADP